MAFASAMHEDELIIHDTTNEDIYMPPIGMSRGLDLSTRTSAGYGAIADKFPSSLLIPRTEWQARIQEMEETKSRISDLSTLAGLPCKDQNGTNYCWVNGPTHCTEIVRMLQNQEMVILSPASAGGPLTGYRNEGGWGQKALQWISDKGLVPIDKWPANAISRQYYTADNQTLALKYRITKWWELEPNNIDQLISMLLRRWPVAVGFNWWSHEVSGVDPVWVDGAIALRIRNSWGMGWGDKGFSILQGNKMSPDDQVCPQVAMAA